MAASRSQKCKGDSPASPLPLLCIDCLAKPGDSLQFKKWTPATLLWESFSHRSACGAPSELGSSGESPAWHRGIAGR